MTKTTRRFVFTLNNYHNDNLAVVRSFLATPQVRYAVFGKEVGEQGTPHLQGYVSLIKPTTYTNLHKKIPGAHIEGAKGNEEQNYEYCTKEGDFEEFGERSNQGKRTDLDSAIELLKEGGIKKVIEEQPREYVKFHRGLEQLEYRLNNQPYEHDDVRGVWIWGPPGTGKSHSARLFAPDAYLKPQNKWWDGYEGQAVVILDDLDTPTLGHYLKIWADKYACSGEFKGGTVHLRHKFFIITSNYTPHQLWPEDEVMCNAVKRRFIMNHKHDRDAPVKFHREKSTVLNDQNQPLSPKKQGALGREPGDARSEEKVNDPLAGSAVEKGGTGEYDSKEESERAEKRRRLNPFFQSRAKKISELLSENTIEILKSVPKV